MSTSTPCSTFLFTIQDYSNIDSLWKYYITSSSLPADWKFIDFDDLLWSSNRNQFQLYQHNNILYLRKSFDVLYIIFLLSSLLGLSLL